jgi:uncharacterized protein YggE
MRTVVTVLAALAVAPVALAQDAKAERVITVTGTATVYAKPDMARIHYGVRVSEPSADAVKDVLTKTNKSIDEAVKKLKLSNLTVTAAPMSMKQAGQNNGGAGLAAPVAPGGAPGGPAPGLGSLLGYTSHTATLTNADPEKLRADVEAFVKAITEAGANTGGGEPKDINVNIFPGQDGSDGPRVVLHRNDDSDARAEALQQAVKKAVKSAQSISKGLAGGEIKVLSVTDTEPEKPMTDPQNFFNLMEGLSSGTAAKSNAGEVEVKVRVVVRCAY